VPLSSLSLLRRSLRPRTFVALLILCGFALASCTASPTGEPDSSEGARFLEPGGALGDETLERGPVWVFFERELSGDLELDLLEATFSPRALARRARNRPSGPLVDVRDRPVSDSHLALLESEGFVVRSTSRWLNAASITGGEGVRATLLEHREVRGLRAVARTRRAPLPDAERGAAAEDLSSELAALELDRVHDAGLLGEGVRIALIDTGFDLSHPALLSTQSRVLESWDFLEDDGVVANETEAEEAEGQDSHGTAVLGVLSADGGPEGYRGAAPSVELLLAKSESLLLEAAFEEDLWIAAVEWAEQRGADLVSSSLGWSDWIDPADLDGQTATSSAFATSFAEATGLLMIQSVGNSGPASGSLVAPSDSPGVLSVGAVDSLGLVAEFSGRGATADGRFKPELVAPGVGVATVVSSSGGFISLGGTSLAAPLVAGLAALAIEAHPAWTLAELRAALLDSGNQSLSPDNERGWGLPSAWAVCGLACTCEDGDGDGAWDVACGGADCDDADASVGPGFPEIPYDGLDQDCDGVDLDDLDGDGFPGGPGGPDCGDLNPAVYPAPLDESGDVLTEGGHELCADSWDNDCDGLLGDADPDCWETADSSGVGATTSSSWGTGGCGLSVGAGDRQVSRVHMTLFAVLLLLGFRRRALRSQPTRTPPRY